MIIAYDIRVFLNGGSTVPDDKATIEHIMPQNLNEEWRIHLGAEAESTHRDYLNTIRNLTLVTQVKNSEFSDGAFEVKKSKLAKHALELNKQYFSRNIAHWGAAAIRNRTAWLTDLILEVWPALEDSPRHLGVKGTVPLFLTVRDNHFDLAPFYGWRGMLIQMVNCLHEIKLLTEFDDAKREFGYLIADEKDDPPKYYKQSSAGWWIYVNLNAENIVRYCQMLARFCGLSDDDWSFTYE